MVEHVSTVFVDRAQVSGHVRQDGILSEVVADYLRDQRVYRLVVSDPISQRVRYGHVSGAVSVDEPGNPDERLLPPKDRVEPFVVEPPVDDMDRIEAARGPHEHMALVDYPVGALDPRSP